MDIETLWEAACSGDVKTLKEYYKNNNATVNMRYDKFDTQHSLIMGAFRNNQFSTVEYLLSVGEDITNQEKEEVWKELKRNEVLKKIGGI